MMEQAFQRRNIEDGEKATLGENQPHPAVGNSIHWAKMKNAYRRMENQLQKQRTINNSAHTQ